MFHSQIIKIAASIQNAYYSRMIPRTTPTCQADPASQQATDDWQTLQAEAFRDPAALLQYLQLPLSLLDNRVCEQQAFSMRVPLDFCQRMEKGNPDDPLLRQVLPLQQENRITAGYHTDPVGDIAACEASGLLHKYHGRVLLLSTAACGIHCRYCFRRHFPYQQHRAEPDWTEAIEYIRTQPHIHEVILSGGDPLTLNEKRLQRLSDALQGIPHIRTLRLHTRQPIVLPQRITPALMAWFDSLPWHIVMVVHCNHANELSSGVRQALQTLRQQGITLLNQSVLLRGVNDDVHSLRQLSEHLFDAGVMPYYLHMLDKVQGAAHFAVSAERAQTLQQQLRAQLPGYLVPQLVTEQAGAKAKTPVYP